MNDRWIRGLLVSTLATSVVAFCGTSAMADTLVVAGTNTGAIPDNDPSGRTISFAASSTQRVSRLAVVLNMTHSWVGDLEATLRSPNGDAQLVLFYGVGSGASSTFGDSSDLDGNYAFADPGPGTALTGDLWAVADSLGPTAVIPSGNYRSSTAGSRGLSNHGGCSTRLDAAFGDAIPQSDGMLANGTWTLNIADHGNGDTGTVSSATLLVVEAESIFESGFDSPPAPQVFTDCIKTTHDLTGNGLADYITYKPNGTDLDWTVLENTGAGTTGAISAFTFGATTDFRPDSADIDGDGIDDPVVFTDATGVFQIGRSTRPGSPPLQISFGPPVAGEFRNPNMLGDYDGDGLDDLGLSRQRGVPPYGPAFVEYIRSSDGMLVVHPAGDNTVADLRTAGGVDFDGDGRADVVQRLGGGADFVIYRGTDGMAQPTFSFGTGSEVFHYPYNRAGDARADLISLGVTGLDVFWQTRTTGTGATSPPLMFGAIITGTSTFPSAADYDGDGLLDYSVWVRQNSGTDPHQFFVMPTSNSGTTWTVDAGSQDAIPLSVARDF